MIGNLKKIYQTGSVAEAGKWYFGIGIWKIAPYRAGGGIRPYVVIGAVKWDDLGEPNILNGRPEKRRGFIKRWECPFGVVFKVIK